MLNVRTLMVLALAATASISNAQNCTTVLTADVAVVSVSTGGVQNITVQTSGVPWMVDPSTFEMIGSFTGTSPGHPHFAYGGLYLNVDRYTLRCENGRSRLIRPVNAVPGFPNHVPLDAQGRGGVQIVVPAGLYSAYVGRTVHHGVYALDFTYLPACGSNTIALTFAP